MIPAARALIERTRSNVWTVCCVDSFVELRETSDALADLVLTDPPYSAHCQGNQVSGTAMRRWVNGEIRTSGIPKKTPKFDPLTGYAFTADLARISRAWALVFCVLDDFAEIRRVVGPEQYVRGGVWYKMNAQGQMTGDRPAAACEGIAILHRPGKKVWNGGGSYGIWACNNTKGEPDRHDYQKPLRLLVDLVRKFSNPGDMVFDPFMGYGRTGEAALLCGRKFVGWDLDPECVARARTRLIRAERRFGILEDRVPLNLCRWHKGDLAEVGR
jgi:hypothetical protein